jgi:transcriptional regulator with XRE-family HTH domain
VARQVEGELDGMVSLARAVGISRSTASRFFSGRSTSLAVTLKLLNVLHLGFEDVARPAGNNDGPDAPTNGGDPILRPMWPRRDDYAERDRNAHRRADR